MRFKAKHLQFSPFLSLGVFLCVHFFLASFAFAHQCREVGFKELNSELLHWSSEKPGTPQSSSAVGPKEWRVVFFASWCSSCAPKLESLKKNPDQKVALVALYDEPQRVDRVLKDLGLNYPCFVDRSASRTKDGIARVLGIKSFPAEAIWNQRELVLIPEQGAPHR